MVLTCALAHQWGACPCGCPEHNRWVQAVQQWTAASANGAASTPGDLLLGDACDHVPLAALHRGDDRPENRWTAELSGAPASAALFIPYAAALPESGWAAQQPAARWQCRASGAARQALLQVFLI